LFLPYPCSLSSLMIDNNLIILFNDSNHTSQLNNIRFGPYFMLLERQRSLLHKITSVFLLLKSKITSVILLFTKPKETLDENKLKNGVKNT